MYRIESNSFDAAVWNGIAESMDALRCCLIMNTYDVIWLDTTHIICIAK